MRKDRGFTGGMGFTLMELLLIMGLTAVMAALTIPTVSRSMEMAKEQHDLTLLQACYTAAQTAAMRDASDGALDGQHRGRPVSVDGFKATAVMDPENTYIEFVDYGNSALQESFQQSGSWDHVENKIDGETIPDDSKNYKGVSFRFTLSGSNSISLAEINMLS